MKEAFGIGNYNFFTQIKKIAIWKHFYFTQIKKIAFWKQTKKYNCDIMNSMLSNINTLLNPRNSNENPKK